jgi:hypothetical protein
LAAVGYKRVLTLEDQAAPDARSLLQVSGPQTGMLCDSGEDARTQFVIVMKSKYEVWPIGAGECTV